MLTLIIYIAVFHLKLGMHFDTFPLPSFDSSAFLVILIVFSHVRLTGSDIAFLEKSIERVWQSKWEITKMYENYTQPLIPCSLILFFRKVIVFVFIEYPLLS